MNVLKKAKQFGIPDLVQIRPKNDKFLFQFESTGSISPQQILLLAIGEIRKKLEKVQKKFTKHKTNQKKKIDRLLNFYMQIYINMNN